MSNDLKPIDYRLRWETANIPAQNRGFQLADYRPYDDDTRYALDKATEFVRTFPQRLAKGKDPALRGRGLLLVGEPGTGKTLLSCAVLTQVHLDHKRDVRFVAAADYYSAMTDIPRLNREASDMSDSGLRLYEIEKQRLVVRSHALICMDDVGKERHTASGYAQEKFDELVRGRFRDALPTVLTSNLPTARWAAVYGDSMRSFIDEAFDLIILRGPDQRARRAR